MVVNEADDAKASASLARLRLFLSSHAPNGPGEAARPASPERPTAEARKDSELDTWHDASSSAPATGEIDAGSSPEVLVDDDDEEESGRTTIPAAGAVASVTPMSQSSKEFARVKYLLQCSLPGYRVHEGVVIWDMRNPSLVAQYEQHTAGLLELESWVAVNDLGADMGDVHSYGFTSLDANQTGMKFTTGNLQLSAPLDSAAEAMKPSSTRQLVLCKIAVGRSLVIRDEEEAKARLPPGYHSYYLHRDDEGGSSEKDQDIQAALLDRGYYHEYILNNTLQVLPQYLVRFTFSAADAHGSAVGPCALCEQHPAAVICRNCEAQICAHCDQEVHSANKLVRRHKRIPLRSKLKALASGGARRGRRRSSTPALVAAIADIGVENLSSLPSTTDPTETQINEIVAKQMEEGLLAGDTQTPTCRTHRDKKVEFYCPACQVPVCVSCKMVGDHSIGEKGSHRLLTVADAYERCLRESLRPDPLITSRKTVIENKLQFLTRVQRSVQENKAQVAAAIKEQCARALRNLDDAVAMKMRVLSGEALEFERQLQQIDWVDESLEDHRTLLLAVEFLSAWSQHKLLRAEQRDFPPFAHGSNNSAEQVKADLLLAGELRVMTADQLATPHHRPSFTSGDSDPPAIDVDNASGGNQGGHTDGSQVELKAAALLAQHRRNGDNDILRKRLLNMKASLPTDPNAGAFMTARRVVTPKCQQLLDEIRHDMLVQNSAKKTPSATTSPRSAGSPRSRFGVPLVGMASRMADSTATLRAFSVQPNAKKASDGGTELRSPAQRQRRGTSAWSTLLRHEMGLGD
ncbi:putative E3 ubiquitin ligase [Phytophthora cinnamomi]|uniref:putative E3 ubiquitin ligase n=1 Tax=Phytophthora cinnamomi TaxID=4785 RepID=UPI00355A26AD|nr:putative E3 ubiquitin ligase [Phytophthora cinnamomi]